MVRENISHKQATAHRQERAIASRHSLDGCCTWEKKWTASHYGMDLDTKKRLFVVSSGFEKMLYGRCQQVDNADERVIVAVSPGPAFGGLEDAVERLDASVAVA